MPPRGRKPLPKTLHVLRGTARADRHGAGEDVRPHGRLPKPPAHLDKVARRFWVGVVAELANLGLGFACDRWDVEHCATLYSRARRAESMMPGGGFYIDTKGAPRRHPAALEAIQCRKELRVALEGLGLSAAGRARLLGNVTPPPKDDAGEFFLFNHKSDTSKYFTGPGISSRKGRR